MPKPRGASRKKDTKTVEAEKNGIVGDMLSKEVSVEDYFAEGMNQYYRELDAKAEAARAEAAKRPRTPDWVKLKHILEDQLVHLPLVTRATQTDWKWVTMARRWRHARLREPRKSAITVAQVQTTAAAGPPSFPVQEEDKLKEDQTSAQTQTAIPAEGVTAAAGIATSADVTVTTSAAAAEGAAGQHRQSTRDSFAIVVQKASTIIPDGTSTIVEETAPSVSEGGEDEGEEGGAAVRKEEAGTSKSLESNIHSDKKGKGHKKHKERGPKHSILARDAAAEPEYDPNKRHKCVDTVDLAFDPYDPKMKYTRIPRDKGKMLSARCSTIIQMWKFKTRMRMATSETVKKSTQETLDTLKIEQDGSQTARQFGDKSSAETVAEHLHEQLSNLEPLSEAEKEGT